MFLAIEFSYASWTSSNSKQYHIQTDEGPERYFRFLTDNGQYRKEKRLQDGTVIGTDAWIDASGFLRQKDYIADDGGYRILKSKTIYVGKDQPIEDALRSLKKVSSSQSSDNVAEAYQTSTIAGLSSPADASYIPTTTPSWLYYDHPSTPLVFIQPKGQQTKNSYNTYNAKSTSAPFKRPFTDSIFYEKENIPSLKLLPPYSKLRPSISVTHLRQDQFEPISSVYSTQQAVTATNADDVYSTHLSALNNELLPPIDKAAISDNTVDDFAIQVSTTPKPFGIEPTKKVAIPIRTNDLDQEPLFSRSANDRQFSQHNPILRTSANYNYNIGSGYEPQFPQYDGTTINDNGFRYYLPRQYHEEMSDAEFRAGSFGYIDPFGIRRVIYYNASPEQGFIHKKNNRYVGLDATPYDPRPI